MTKWWHRSHPGPPRPPRKKSRRGGRIAPTLMPEWGGTCWLCGDRGRLKWEGKWWCWWHHPLHPDFSRRRWNHRQGTSARDIAKHQRKVGALLGRKKRKPAKARRRARDRQYRR